MRTIFLALFLAILCTKLLGQECPNRIGDFVLNSTTISNFPKTCSYCSTTFFSKIKDGDDYQEKEVSDDYFDEDWAGMSSVFELIKDTNSLGSWYSKDYASICDSVRVIFIPNYESNGIFLKNLILKFYNDTLYYIQANVSKKYLEILTEKYKGKGYKTNEKSTKHSCPDQKFQKFKNRYSEYYFTDQQDNRNYARLIFDLQITKKCELYRNDRIEIFNKDVYLNVLKCQIRDFKKYVDSHIKRKQEERKDALERF